MRKVKVLLPFFKALCEETRLKVIHMSWKKKSVLARLWRNSAFPSLP